MISNPFWCPESLLGPPTKHLGCEGCETSSPGARSGEIVGILKAMKDEMDKDLNGAVSEEESAQKSFEGMKAAKESRRDHSAKGP